MFWLVENSIYNQIVSALNGAVFGICGIRLTYYNSISHPILSVIFEL